MRGILFSYIGHFERQETSKSLPKRVYIGPAVEAFDHIWGYWCVSPYETISYNKRRNDFSTNDSISNGVFNNRSVLGEPITLKKGWAYIIYDEGRRSLDHGVEYFNHVILNIKETKKDILEYLLRDCQDN